MDAPPFSSDSDKGEGQRASRVNDSIMSMQLKHGIARRILHDRNSLGDPRRGHDERTSKAALRTARQANLER
jgi:hypothetical protein